MDDQKDDQMKYLAKRMRTTAYGDYVPTNQEQLRRIRKAQEVGLIQPVPIKTPFLDLNADNYDEETHQRYKQLAYQVAKNHEELLKLGIPEEKLTPFVMKKMEEAQEMANLYKDYELPERIQPLEETPESEYNMRLLKIGKALNIKPEDLLPE